MILKIRIDDRLLHGQVAYSWKARLGYNAIVIASNEAANDELRKAALKMCCPPDTKLATRTIEKAAELLRNEQLKNMKVFVICANPQSAYELVKLIEEKPIINLGSIQMHEGAKLFSKAVYLNDEDISYLDKLVNEGYFVEVQEVPETSMQNYESLRAKLSK